MMVNYLQNFIKKINYVIFKFKYILQPKQNDILNTYFKNLCLNYGYKLSTVKKYKIITISLKIAFAKDDCLFFKTLCCILFCLVV